MQPRRNLLPRWPCGRRGLTVGLAFALLLVVALLAQASDPVLDQDTGRRKPSATPSPTASVNDTIWIAEWSFDTGALCDSSGWQVRDNRILYDGSNKWHVDAGQSGTGAVTQNAAILSEHDLCWPTDGYSNDWDYSLTCRYVGAATLSFDYLLDSDSNDVLKIEADSLGSSESQVDYGLNPGRTAAGYRTLLYEESGLNAAGHLDSLSLPDFGAPTDTHVVYIRFFSDGDSSPADGGYASTLGIALVVDNLQVSGALAYQEDFDSGALSSHIALVNSAPATPFGTWLRLGNVTDNDVCGEDLTCAWHAVDPTLPAYQGDMAFGPGGAVVRNWLDNVVVGPWVSLLGTPDATQTLLQFREFPGNLFSQGRIVRNWSVRSRVRVADTDTPQLGDSVDCITPWAHTGQWNSLSLFTWTQRLFDLTDDIAPGARDIQLRMRISDWQYIAGASAPSPFDPGPGPYIDDVRIGRRAVAVPQVSHDTGSLAQDSFARSIQGTDNGNPIYEPTQDRFGTCDFSQASINLWWSNIGGNLVYHPSTRDSLTIDTDNGTVGVTLYAAVVDGPHAGKAPPPWNIGSNGFFAVPFQALNLEHSRWWVDLDDDYFRGSDVVVYFFLAESPLGAMSSDPPGLTGVPASIDDAMAATGGLYEFNALPQIDWDPAYLARIAADPSGKLDPTPQEIANSQQRNCILVAQARSWERRSGDAHRTRFMFTLDQLGYRDHYDVYDYGESYGGTNNHLASHASVAQATGYALIVEEPRAYGSESAIPQGNRREGYYAQSQWYRDWLAQASTSEIGRATLWVFDRDLATEILSEDVADHIVTNEMGVVALGTGQSQTIPPELVGVANATWASGDSTQFDGDLFDLVDEYCGPNSQNSAWDNLGTSGTAFVAHRYGNFGIPGDGATVINTNPAASWNTILMSFHAEDLIAHEGGTADGLSQLTAKVLQGVLPSACLQTPNTTDTQSSLPRASALLGNHPNPFNPVTTIRYDLADDGRVRIDVFDVAGRHVRTLEEAHVEAGYGRTMLWDGRNDRGASVASGIYLYRMTAGSFQAARRMVVLK